MIILLYHTVARIDQSGGIAECWHLAYTNSEWICCNNWLLVGSEIVKVKIIVMLWIIELPKSLSMSSNKMFSIFSLRLKKWLLGGNYFINLTTYNHKFEADVPGNCISGTLFDLVVSFVYRKTMFTTASWSGIGMRNLSILMLNCLRWVFWVSNFLHANFPAKILKRFFFSNLLRFGTRRKPFFLVASGELYSWKCTVWKILLDILQ